MKKRILLVVVLGWLVWPAETGAAHFVNDVSIWGEATDLTDPAAGSGAAVNRLGGFGSAIWYDQAQGFLYAAPDAGPGGGILSYEARLQKFSLDIDPVTGALSNFHLVDTIRFKNNDGSEIFNGQGPSDPQVLGNSFDPEGLAIGPTGSLYLGDEYGPSIYEFNLVEVGGKTEARYQRAFSVPSGWLPIDTNGNPDFAGASPASGRQKGRGIESLTLSPDGATLFAMVQDPLINEGGRNARNVRLAQFDVATGVSTAEYIYQLESIDQINLRVPDAPFAANQQGRNISNNDMIALSDHELLVLERDNRGVGVNNPLGDNPILSAIGTKRVYRVDLAGASDVSEILLPASGELPTEVTAVSKSLFFDVHAKLAAAGRNVAEKLEGLSLVPLSGDQPFALLVASDNDFSVLDVVNPDTGAIDLFDICADGTQLPMDGDLGTKHLLPSYVYSFAVPEPGIMSLLLALAGCGLTSTLWRRTTRV